MRDGRVRIHPKELEPRYFAWTDNLQDWCISRQLWWGHRIPVWYGPNGETVCVGPDEEPPGAGWTQDPDVLDTWFSSGLWPFSTLGWPEDTADLRKFYPTSVLVTGYDILFFWVARMMMFGLYAMKDRGPQESVPFRTVSLHGLVRDQFGKKMSKSRGNGVDPLTWMDAYGSDAVRFTLARGANPGTDLATSEEWVAGLPQLLQQDLERDPLRADERRRPGRAAGPRAAERGGPLDPLAADRGDRRGRRVYGGLPARQGLRSAVPLRLGRGVRLVRGAGQGTARRAAAPRRTPRAPCSATCWM